MAAEVPFDVVEKILIGLDVKDLLRFKSVCKSWQSLISSPGFVNAHLKHDVENTGDSRRIVANCIVSRDEGGFFMDTDVYIAGSCNGLLCVSSGGDKLEVTNPWTRETKKLQTPPFRPERDPVDRLFKLREVVHHLGFGYDASIDDYKVIAGFKDSILGGPTVFHALTLKSNMWKVIGKLNYQHDSYRSGVLCGGALHWFMASAERNRAVLISLDLSTEECKEIPYPAESNDYHLELGVIQGCLCIYSLNLTSVPKIEWIMKNNKWKLYDNKIKYDVARYFLTRHQVLDSRNRTRIVYAHDDGWLLPSVEEHVHCNIFHKSLISPHPPKEQPEGNGAKGNKRQRSSKHKRELVVVQLKGNSVKGKIRKTKRSSKHKRTLVYELLVGQLEGNSANGKIRKRSRKRKRKHKRAIVL